jgi:hypothetical protein
MREGEKERSVRQREIQKKRNKFLPSGDAAHVLNKVNNKSSLSPFNGAVERNGFSTG